MRKERERERGIERGRESERERERENFRCVTIRHVIGLSSNLLFIVEMVE